MPREEQQFTAELHLVRVDRLELGWVVDEDIFADAGVLLKQGTEITSSVLRGIRRRGLSHVQVKPTCELVTGSNGGSLKPNLTELLMRSSEVYVQHGIETAITPEVLELATDELEELFSELELGKQVDVQQVRPVVEMLIQQFQARSHLALKLLDLDRLDRYTYRHSINVGLLYLAIAQDWFSDEAQLVDAVFGAILHDLGMVRVGREMVNQQNELSAEQRTRMQQHTTWGSELLEQAGASPEVVSMAGTHHERLDGSGYPLGLKGDELDRDARLVAICDVYDAVSTNRCYKRKQDFALAIDILIQGCGQLYDPVIANQFIRKVGRYPVGTFVRLNTDEVAVVRSVNQATISSPVVSRVLDADCYPIPIPEELDLAREPELYIASLVVSDERPG